MGTTFKAREGPKKAVAPTSPRIAENIRPGLPLTLTAGPGETAAAEAQNLRGTAREARSLRELRSEDSPEIDQTDDTLEGPEAAGGEGEGEQTRQDTGHGGEGEGVSDAVQEGTATQAPGGGEGREESDPRATPLQITRRSRSSPFKKKAESPVIPRVDIPDRAGIRSPIVPPPPKSILEKRLNILQKTGSLPEAHHAQVQRAVDSVADAARAGQRNVIFQVGTTAGRTRSDIEAMAREIPGIVSGGVARIRAGAAAVAARIDTIADQQIRAVIDHTDRAREGIGEAGNETAERMHQMLMEEAPQMLRDAKVQMDAGLQAHADAARGRIEGIKTGQRPVPLDNRDPLGNARRAEARAEAERENPTPPEEAPAPPTWDRAEAEIAGVLGTDMPQKRLTQFANLRCASALPGLVTPHREAYDTANQAAQDRVGGPDMVRQFLESTMGLIVPAVREEERHTDRVDNSAYIGSFTGALGREYMQLSNDKQSIVRQIDEKRIVLKEETLKPDHEGSLPHSGIKGLREAGEKIEQGLRDQARVIEASLRANIASLALQYPDIVVRLLPIINSGGFLEATTTLSQIVEARKSVGIMENGQIEMVAQQAEEALAQARRGFKEQVKSLHKTARKSVEGMQEYGARAHYDLVRTTAMYTGNIDEGVRQAFPQILAHAERTARRLLGPRQNSQMGFSNIETAAVNHLNGVIQGEWRGYIARLNGLEEALGGMEYGPIADTAETGSEFGRIRNGVKADAVDRAQKVEAEMTPAPLSNSDRVWTYGGAAIAAPFTGGASVYGTIAYDIYSDPDESDIVAHLAVPWPGPPAIDQAQTGIRNRTSLVTLIEERLASEGEQADILGLFSSDAATREQSKTNLIVGSESVGGISGDAALSLTQSFTSEELSSEFMSEEDRRRMGEALADSLDNADQQEIAAAYLNGQPDQALAIRMRVLFDRQRGKDYNDQLQTGAELDRLIRQELFGGGQYAYVPPTEMARLRDAAFLRFDEVSREGRRRVTISAEAPDRAAVDTGAVSPTQIRTVGRQQQVYGPPLPPEMTVGYGLEAGPAETPPGAEPPALPTRESTAPAPDTAGESPATEPPPSPAQSAPTTTPARTPGQQATESVEDDSNADREARRETDLDRARRQVIEYMNRPVQSYQSRRNSDHVENSLDRYTRMDQRHRHRSYDRETGRVTLSPASAIQDYNRALILHGHNSPEARGARAGAAIAWMPNHGSPSENQINILNENFSDGNYNAMRVRWENATPAERARMQPDWEKAQRDHQTFLREAARNMGMDQDQLDDPDAVEEFVTGRLGDQFARVDEDYRDVGHQLVSQGRISIDTGMDLAADGWGTNEQLMQNVMADRSEHEWNQRRGDGRTMRQYAYAVADSELSGDDWQQAREKLRGPDENDFERAETAHFLIDQQLEEGTSWLSSLTMRNTWQKEDLERRRGDVDDRLLVGMQAGIEEARRRGIDVPEDEIPTSARLPNGRLHPLVRRFAMDGDGNLRGEGPSMAVLVGDARQSADYYKAEIDRQEGIFTSIITALAVIASVVALIIPGVNAVAAGILIALLAGAATVAVKSGMRGSRYGWEEAAVDVGSAAIEAATAGIGGAVSRGARLAAAARAAKLAGDAAEAAAAAQKISRLGRLGKLGVAMHNRMGPIGAAIVQESVTGAVSGAANASMNDQMWDDGVGRGILRMGGHALQGAASSAVNVGISSKVTKGLDSRLAPMVGDAANAGKLNRLGAKLGGEGRELLTEVVSGLAGSLSSEGVNILADLARHPDKMTLRQALERLGKSGLQELVSTGGRTLVQQRHRRRVNAMAAEIMARGRDPTPAEALMLRRISQSAGIVSPDMTTGEYVANFSRARSRIADMPADIQPVLRQMSPGKALELVAMLDSGQLGTRAQRIEFTRSLGQEVVGLDVAAFDKALVRANEEHAPQRRARKARIKTTNEAMLRGVRGPERAALKGLDFSDLADLPPETQKKLARALAEGETDFRDIIDVEIPDNPGLRRRVQEQMNTAAETTGEARAQIAAKRARIRDDLAASTPDELRASVEGLKHRDAAALHKHLQDGSPEALARATAILRQSGLSPEGAMKATRQMAGKLIEQASRGLYMDNVPPAHREAMGQLTADALMEVRVAQFTKEPLDDARLEAILADVRKRRPEADLDTLRMAITKTVATRHGRPGFRQALAQKRAFLSLVPFGMKGEVLRTPMITLPDDAFLSFVRGKGSENAVTLIVNGRPVVLMREGADPRKLAEEGLHVLQYHDPAFRNRLTSLDERKIARWDDMTLDEQISAYREKVDIEIDAQERMIGRLQDRAENALWPGARKQALKQLLQAETALRHLTERRGDVGGLNLEMRRLIELGIEEMPDWLQQPARMFNKGHEDSKLVDKHMPAARAPVRQAYYDLTSRVADLPRIERKRLLNLLRTMKGAVTMEELRDTLKLVNSGSKDDAHAHLQNISADQVVDRVRDHLFEKIREGDVETRATELKDRIGKRKFSDIEKENAGLQRLFKDTIDALHNDSDGATSPQLVAAKRAMFLALEKFPDNASNKSLRQQLELTAKVLGIGGMGDELPQVQGKPRIQAFILEGLATNKSLLKGKHDFDQASQDALVTAVQNIIDGGIADYPLAAQRSVFETLARAYFSGADRETLIEIGNLPKKLREAAGEAGLATARTVLMTSLEFLSRMPPDRYKEILQKIGPLLAHAVDLRRLSHDEQAVEGRVKGGDINRYIARAIRVLQKNPRFAASLIRFGHRARKREKLEGPKLEPSERKRIEEVKPIATGQESFLQRHMADLEGPGVGQDVLTKRETTVEQVHLLANAQKPPLEMTEPEARSIAKRIEVLDQSGLFGVLAGRPTAREALLKLFFQELKDNGLAAIPDPQSSGLTAKKIESLMNARGEAIEKTFRKFVRGTASVAGGEGLLQTLAGGPIKVGDSQINLSETARIELMLMMVRGAKLTDTKALPKNVVVELEAVKTLMVEEYLKNIGGERTPANDEKVRVALREMLGEGFINIEKSAKGAMLEHMVEGLLSIGRRGDSDIAVPKMFDEVSSATKATKHEFQSVDQIDDKNPRSLDNVIKVEDAKNLPAGIKKDDKIGTDSKNGPGAFTPDQFRCYLVEMLNGFSGKESIFGSDPAKLTALLYLADSPENAKHAHAAVTKVIAELLDAIKSPDQKTVILKIGDHEETLDVETLRKHAGDLNVFFGHIGQTQAPGSTVGHQLGPFRLENFGDSVSQMIRDRLGPPEDEIEGE